MTELTLEILAKRIDELERRISQGNGARRRIGGLRRECSPIASFPGRSMKKPSRFVKPIAKFARGVWRMILLDSDHLTVLKYRGSERFVRLTERLSAVVGDPVGTTIVNIEEQMRGWLASLARSAVVRQVPAYRELAALFDFFSRFHVAHFTDDAATRFQDLRADGVRIGTMDLKTACIALGHHALLLTANRKDFEKVPGLHFENWLD